MAKDRYHLPPRTCDGNAQLILIFKRSQSRSKIIALKNAHSYPRGTHVVSIIVFQNPTKYKKCLLKLLMCYFQ